MLKFEGGWNRGERSQSDRPTDTLLESPQITVTFLYFLVVAGPPTPHYHCCSGLHTGLHLLTAAKKIAMFSL